MFGILSNILNDGADHLRRRIISVYVLLIGANVLVWVWAFSVLHDRPVLLGTALLAYTFGLRHAVDADHIAAIDNVTRKLMQEGKRPVTVGFFFALGHSAVVVAMSAAIAIATVAVQSHFDQFKAVGDVVSTIVSASFLFVIAVANILILVSILNMFLLAFERTILRRRGLL